MHEGEAKKGSVVSWLMNQGPLAVGVGAGAGGLSSALLAAVLGQFRPLQAGRLHCKCCLPLRREASKNAISKLPARLRP